MHPSYYCIFHRVRPYQGLCIRLIHLPYIKINGKTNSTPTYYLSIDINEFRRTMSFTRALTQPRGLSEYALRNTLRRAPPASKEMMLLKKFVAFKAYSVAA